MNNMVVLFSFETMLSVNLSPLTPQETLKSSKPR